MPVADSAKYFYYFRIFCDNLFRPEDTEIFASVSCILRLEDTNFATMMDPQQIMIDEDHDPCMPQQAKLNRTLERNIEARASTSMDSIKSYESLKAEKIFQHQINIRHINKVPFTKLLRAGTNICCHFQESIG